MATSKTMYTSPAVQMLVAEAGSQVPSNQRVLPASEARRKVSPTPPMAWAQNRTTTTPLPMKMANCITSVQAMARMPPK